MTRPVRACRFKLPTYQAGRFFVNNQTPLESCSFSNRMPIVKRVAITRRVGWCRNAVRNIRAKFSWLALINATGRVQVVGHAGQGLPRSACQRRARLYNHTQLGGMYWPRAPR